MGYLYEAFENGLSQPYRFISDSEALQTACRAVGVFASPYSSQMERQMIMYDAGRNVGAIRDSNTAYTVKNILIRCAQLRDGEAISLSRDEKAFIKAAIEGTLYKPFYE